MNKCKATLTSHRWLPGPTALAASGVGYILGTEHPFIVGVPASARELPIYFAQRDNKAVSLTF